MAAYVIATEQVTDEVTFGRYTKEVPATLEPFGGRLVVWRSNRARADDERVRPQLAVIEFPSRQQAKAWLRSGAYRRALTFRPRSSTGHISIATGIDGLRRALQTRCRETMTPR